MGELHLLRREQVEKEVLEYLKKVYDVEIPLTETLGFETILNSKAEDIRLTKPLFRYRNMVVLDLPYAILVFYHLTEEKAKKMCDELKAVDKAFGEKYLPIDWHVYAVLYGLPLSIHTELKVNSWRVKDVVICWWSTES